MKASVREKSLEVPQCRPLVPDPYLLFRYVPGIRHGYSRKGALERS
jgi:hypothetical protein